MKRMINNSNSMNTGGLAPRALGVLAGAMTLAAGLTMGLGGCAGYASWPPVQGNTMATADPNSGIVQDAMVVALNAAIEKYPGIDNKPVAINLPSGVSRGVYESVASRTRSAAVTPENASTSAVYHVARVWVRGWSAMVDIVLPVTTPSRGAATPEYRGVTIHLKGEGSPMKFNLAQEWQPGTVPTPELNYVGATAAAEAAAAK